MWEADKAETVLDKEDVVAVLRHLIHIRDGKEVIDDVDSLATGGFVCRASLPRII